MLLDRLINTSRRGGNSRKLRGTRNNARTMLRTLRTSTMRVNIRGVANNVSQYTMRIVSLIRANIRSITRVRSNRRSSNNTSTKRNSVPSLFPPNNTVSKDDLMGNQISKDSNYRVSSKTVARLFPNINRSRRKLRRKITTRPIRQNTRRYISKTIRIRRVLSSRDRRGPKRRIERMGRHLGQLFRNPILSLVRRGHGNSKRSNNGSSFTRNSSRNITRRLGTI